MQIVYNQNLWKQRLLKDFIPSVRRVEETFLNRILPTFSTIDAESEEFAERLWNDAMS